MEINADKLLIEAIRDGLREAVKAKLHQSYDNPVANLLSNAIREQAPAIQALFAECIEGCLADAKICEEIADQTRRTLAKQLVARFGGEMEKQVNALKSDPATRARITLAIDQIVRERAAAADDS